MEIKDYPHTFYILKAKQAEIVKILSGLTVNQCLTVLENCAHEIKCKSKYTQNDTDKIA